MKTEIVGNVKKFSGKKCTICQVPAATGKPVVTVTIPNAGFSWTHVWCVRELIGPDDHEIETEWNRIRNELKENGGFSIDR
jgi:hypothetical protein